MSTSVSLGTRHRRRRLLLASSAVVTAIAVISYHYYSYTLSRRAQLQRTAALQRARDVSAFASCFYSLIQQHCGGPLNTACLHDTQRLQNGDILLFCAGGWAAVPPSSIPLPVYAPPAASRPQSALELYWLSRCLGKSLVFNAAFAFFLALLLRRHQLERETDAAAVCPVSHRALPVHSLSLCMGSFCSAASLPAVSICCEIGTVDSSRMQQLQDSRWGMEPDLEGSDLALCARFGSMHVRDAAVREGRLPAAQSPALQDVLWRRESFPWSRAQQLWLTVETEEGRFHLDLSAPQYGIPHSFLPTASSASTLPSTLLDALRTQRPDILEYAPPHSSCFRPQHAAPSPCPQLLTEAEWAARGGRVERRVEGVERVLDWVQQELLINSAALSVEYVQVEAMLRDACRMRAVSSRLLYQLLYPR